MPKKQSTQKQASSLSSTSANPQQFLLKFIEKNFERRQIDEQSFVMFNEFTSILSKELEKKINLVDVQGFVTMIRTVFINFDFLNRGKSTFLLFLQLLEICMRIFEKAVAIDLSRDICCELIDVLWPVYEANKKQEPFPKMEDKFSKINMPKQLTESETMTKIHQFNSLPELWSANRYDRLIGQILKNHSEGSSTLQSVVKGFLSLQGENYLDSVLKILLKCGEQSDFQRFRKILKIYIAIGDSTADQSKNLSILITKALSIKNKVQIISTIFTQTEPQKLFQPNYLFYVCISSLDSIFSQKNISDKTIDFMKTINKYLTVFKKVKKVTEEQKLMGLYNKVLEVILKGKYVKQGQVEKKKLRGTQLLKQKLQKYDRQRQESSSIKKFSFIHQLASQLNQMEAEMEQQQVRKQQQSPKKQQAKIQPLKPEQIQQICKQMKKLMMSFSKHQIVSQIITKVYESQTQTQSFLSMCGESANISPQILQLILSVYIPLLSESNHFRNIASSSTLLTSESSLIKVIKLHILEYKIEKQDLRDDDIIKLYYWPIHERLGNGEGTNFDFLALAIMHQYIDDTASLIKLLAKSCLTKIQENNQQKAVYFRFNIALIASLLDIHHNIVIKLSYNRIKSQITKLNSKFQIQDFLQVNEIKQNKIFMSGPRIEISKQKQAELDLIRSFISDLFSKTQQLGDLINLPNSQQNSYYYMILIQLCNICMQRNPKFVVESQQVQSIIRLRKNSKYTLVLNVSNEIVSMLKDNIDESKPLNLNEQIQLLHLFLKMQILFFETGQQDQTQKLQNTHLNHEDLSQLSTQITKLLQVLGRNPSFQSLQIINKSLDLKEDLILNQQVGNTCSDQVQNRKNKLKDFVKQFQIIKFYSQAKSVKELLVLTIIKSGIKLIEKLWEKMPVQKVEEQKENIKSIRLLYDNKPGSQNESDRKSIQAYIKLRLLAQTSENPQNKLSIDEIKNMVKHLQQNYQQVSKLLISEQTEARSLCVENLFNSKTNFIGYLLQQVTRSDNQSSSEREISLLILNFLKTLIENSTQVLEIAKRYTFLKLQNSEAFPKLVLQRTKKSVAALKESMKVKSIQKMEQAGEQKKNRICEKEEQKILQENKQIYLIFSKMLSSVGNLKLQKQQSITKMVDDIISLDAYDSIYISVYILRELINIAPILKFTLSKESFQALTQRFFQFLMALRQVYEGVPIQSNSKNPQNQFNISTIISFFVYKYYTYQINQDCAFELSDKIVVVDTDDKQENKVNNEAQTKQKKVNLTCLLNQKKNTYRCLKCDSNREICVCCMLVCHKDHPIIYIPQTLRVSKSCQCPEENCKINPLFMKQKKEKRKQKIPKDSGYYARRANNPTSALVDQLRPRDMFGSYLQEQLDNQQVNYTFGRQIPSALSSQPFIQTVYKSSNQPPGMISIAPGQYQGQSRLFGFPPGMIATNVNAPGMILPTFRGGNLPPGSTGQPGNLVAVLGGNSLFDDRNSEIQMALGRFNPRNAYEGIGRGQNESDQRMLRQKQRRDRQMKQKQRQRAREREREREQVRQFMQQSRYGGINQLAERLEHRSNDYGQQVEEQEDFSKDKFEEEDYQATQLQVKQEQSDLRAKRNKQNSTLFDLTAEQTYLLPIFMNMTAELCESRKQSSKDKQAEITWHIKLISPIQVNPGIIHTTSKMCAAKSFNTRLPKNEAFQPPSPCVSRCPIAISDRFVFILSGPKITIHLKQLIFTYLSQKNGTNIVYNYLSEQHLQFEPHSVTVGHKNLLCIAGIHQLSLFQFDQNGQLVNRNSPLRQSINNDNINKVILTKFGIFIGLNRQIRLLAHNLQIKAQFKMPDALVKEFNVVESTRNGVQIFTVYITISEGYIYYVDGNSTTSGELPFAKKINDSRVNRPVGVFVLSKKLDDCGNLLLSTFKEKNIGHSLGRLSSESNLTDINYIKLNNQGLDPATQKFNILGLSDMALGPNDDPNSGKQLYIVTIFKQDKTYDMLGVHRGILGVIRIKQDILSGNSKYQTQFVIGQQEKCEYFQIIHFEDRKNWIVLSMSEDGGLRVTMPFKISKQALDKEVKLLKQKKSADKLENLGKLNRQQSQSNQTSRSQQPEPYQRLSNSIKQNFSIRSIKQSKSSSNIINNNLLSQLQNSDILRIKQDFTMFTLSASNQNKIKNYQIKLLNKKKVITGFSLPQFSDVVLPTRKITGVFDVAFTLEQTVYFWAFGGFRLEVRPVQGSEYSRDSNLQKKKSMQKEREKQRDSLFHYEVEKMFLNNPIPKIAGDLSLYGQMFETSFKQRAHKILSPILFPEHPDSPYELTLEKTLKLQLSNICMLLQASIQSCNTDIITPQQCSAFVECIKNRLLNNKQNQDMCNRLYPMVKKVIYKMLRLQESAKGMKKHVLHDEDHPLRLATENKIALFYEALMKAEMGEKDAISLIQQLYGFVAGESAQVGAVNELPQIDLLLYYIAKYPALILKLHKKIKSSPECQKLAYKLIPLYVFGYRCLNYLGYHLQWLLPALYELVGKVTPQAPGQPARPSILSRFILYKYLKFSQLVKLEPWLKSIEGIDAHQCMKQIPMAKNNSSGGMSGLGGLGGFGLTGLADFGVLDYGNGQFEMQNDDQMIKRIMEMSQRQLAEQNQQQQQNPAAQQQQNLMEQEAMANQIDPLLKSLMEDLLHELDYSQSAPISTSVAQTNAQKATVIYVIYKLAIFDAINKIQGCKQSFLYLMQLIQKNVQHLCEGYQDGVGGQGNGNPVLMMWLNLFGLICKQSHFDEQTSKVYDNIKQNIIKTLSTKFKVQNVKKQPLVPNLFSRRLKGLKISTKCHYIYGFISVLQKPCEANFVLLTMGCYWLFPEDQSYYNKKKYVQTIRENEKTGNIKNIHQTAMSNIQVWKEVGNPEWLQEWVQQRKQNWQTAIELLTLYYE